MNPNGSKYQVMGRFDVETNIKLILTGKLLWKHSNIHQVILLIVFQISHNVV